MTTFADMQALVREITKRQELVGIIDGAIRMATIRAHNVDFFKRDRAIKPLTYSIPPSESVWVDIANISTALPRLRAFEKVYSVDQATLTPVEELTLTNQFFDQTNTLKWHVFDLIGDTLRVRAQRVTGRFDVYYYQNPDVTSAAYFSWIANEFPEEVAYWAAGIVWARTGNVEQARITQEQHVMPFKDLLVATFLLNSVV